MIKLQAHSCFRSDHFIITALINVSECPASFLSRNSLPLSPLLRSLGSERGFSMTPSPGPGCCYAGAAARNAAAVVLLLVVVLLSLKFTCSFLNTRDKYSHEIVVIIQIYTSQFMSHFKSPPDHLTILLQITSQNMSAAVDI